MVNQAAPAPMFLILPPSRRRRTPPRSHRTCWPEYKWRAASDLGSSLTDFALASCLKKTGPRISSTKPTLPSWQFAKKENTKTTTAVAHRVRIFAFIGVSPCSAQRQNSEKPQERVCRSASTGFPSDAQLKDGIQEKPKLGRSHPTLLA